ncbi:MAG TPA: zinc ribbon domain-containing protein [Longimicrobiaceae bacterium]|jgi:hypothetical protein
MDPLDRLYWRLVESLRRERPGTSWELTVAEIYQQLVPYRTIRADLGFAELPEYEHALLRLLAGERDYVSLGIPEVQEELQRELRAPNPILGLYRDYAAVVVRLNPAPRPRPAAPAPPAADDVTADPAAPPAAAAPVAPAQPAPLPARPPMAEAPQRGAAPEPPSMRTPPHPPRQAAPAPPRPALCRACRSPLPEGREVRFCPQCGATQRPLPCAGCGELVEPEWKFCVGCGQPQRPPGDR